MRERSEDLYSLIRKNMKRRIFLLALSFFAVLTGGACTQDEAMEVGKEPKTFDTGSDKLTLYKDIRYGDVPEGINPSDRSSDRLLDLYVPTAPAPAGGYPVFLFVHGGGFSGGDKSDKTGYNAICKNMAERGYAVVSMNYYLTRKYEKVDGVSCASEMKDGLPASGEFHPLIQKSVRNASDDATLVLEWIKENAEKYHLDTDFVAVCGGSAGAMTVLHLTYVSGQKVLPIRAVVDLWGGMENPSKIEAPAAPMLIFHGNEDALINVAYAYAFEKRMNEIGAQVELHIMKGKGHAQYGYIAKEEHMDDIDAFLTKLR